MDTWEIVGIALMPVTYGFVGWLTNTVALHMTLYPLEFKGIKPYFGWQGIVPRKASILAMKAVQLLTTHVVKIEEFFARVKPKQLKMQFAPLLRKFVPGVVERELAALDADLKARLPEDAQKTISKAAVESSKAALDTFAEHLETDVRKVFNFKGLVMRNVTGDNVKHLVEIFRTVGSKELAFIRRSGWVFGGLLGLVQVGIWLVFPKWWTLPIQGALVGGITNFLALTMIFRPLRKRRILGVPYQGLFLKRQAEVSEEYAALFSERVLDARSVMEEILHRPIARSTVDAVQRGIVDQLAATPDAPEDLAARVETELEGARKESVEVLAGQFADGAKMMEKMVGRTMNVQSLIADRMKQLPPEEFEPILHSAFQEDEHILIILGAVFGALVGLVQGLVMMGGT